MVSERKAERPAPNGPPIRSMLSGVIIWCSRLQYLRLSLSNRASKRGQKHLSSLFPSLPPASSKEMASRRFLTIRDTRNRTPKVHSNLVRHLSGQLAPALTASQALASPAELI